MKDVLHTNLISRETSLMDSRKKSLSTRKQNCVVLVLSRNCCIDKTRETPLISKVGLITITQNRTSVITPAESRQQQLKQLYKQFSIGLVCWSKGMILPSGVRGPGFNSRTGPGCIFLTHFKLLVWMEHSLDLSLALLLPFRLFVYPLTNVNSKSIWRQPNLSSKFY